MRKDVQIFMSLTKEIDSVNIVKLDAITGAVAPSGETTTKLQNEHPISCSKANIIQSIDQLTCCPPNTWISDRQEITKRFQSSTVNTA